jgi:hypothetical protein
MSSPSRVDVLRKCHFCDAIAVVSREEYGFIWYFCEYDYKEMVEDPRVTEEALQDA